MVNTMLPSFMYRESPYKIYGVSIDLTNPDPFASVTYTDDAVGMVPGSNAWDETPVFSGIKPCVMQTISFGGTPGKVSYYLNKNNYNQREDGSLSELTGIDGTTVMVELPKIGYQIITSGDILTIRITNNPNNPDFKYYAFSRDTEGDRDKLYIGAYKITSNTLRSTSGSLPLVNMAIGDVRVNVKPYATNGGFDVMGFYQLTLLQCLYLIRYKSLNSQVALGRGYVDGNAGPTVTGGTNTKGMYYGSQNGNEQMKFAGIEDLWGNVFEFIDGLVAGPNREILTAFKDFNNTGAGYKNNGVGTAINLTSYMTKPQGTSETGFILKEGNGSSSTYFSCYTALFANCIPMFGGSWDTGSLGVGGFCMLLNQSTASNNVGARLMYL